MDIIQISPPKKINFSIPNDLHRKLTITNLTLRFVYIGILKSHAYQLGVSNDWFLMQPFQQIKIDIVINWNQQSKNLTAGKLRIYYWQIEDENGGQNYKELMFQQQKMSYEDIDIQCHLDFKTVDSLNYRQITNQHLGTYQSINNQVNKKYYLMKRVHPQPINQIQREIVQSHQLKNQVLNYLQKLKHVVSIEAVENEQTYLMEFTSTTADHCDFVTFSIDNVLIVFSVTRIIFYGKSYQIPTLVNIEDDQQLEIQNNAKNENHKKTQSIFQISPARVQKNIQVNKKVSPQVQENKEQQSPSKIQKQKKKKEAVKQSFAIKRQDLKNRHKRRNRSEQKIKENSQQDDEDEEIPQFQFKNYKQIQNKQPLIEIKEIKIRREIKINQTNIQMNQKVLNIYVQTKEKVTQIYVLLKDCVRCFILQDLNAKKIIKFDPIQEENIGMPCPIDIYKDELIFGNQSYLFWVNLQTGYNQWKYVQRKYIYALAVIQELSLVALGGKNFSKLSYFGKETSRSNLKMYSCSSSDKHDHLFTYDFPGNNVGNVINLAYITAPPHGTKLILAHTLNSQGKSSFYFLRIKAFNNLQIYAQIEIDELGILNLLKFKYNKETNRVICMQSLGQTNLDTYKRLKIKCQYQKVEVATEGFKFPLKRYISYHVGGGAKGGAAREWMSLVQENGKVFHLYDFESNKIQQFDMGKGQIKQVIPIYNGRYLLICSDTVIRIRQKVQIEVKE